MITRILAVLALALPLAGLAQTTTSSGVTAGTYGSATQAAVITVSKSGLVTAASNATSAPSTVADNIANSTAATDLTITPTGDELVLAASKSFRMTGSAGATPPVAGGVDYDTTKKAHVFQNPIGLLGNAGLLYAAPDDSNAVANTTTETDFDNLVSIPASSLTVGKVARITATLRYSTTGTPTIRIRWKLGSVTIADSSTLTTASGASSQRIIVTSIGVVRSIGGSGTISTGGTCMSGVSGFFIGFGNVNSAAATTTIDTTATADCKISAQWGTASASNTVTMENFVVEVLN